MSKALKKSIENLDQTLIEITRITGGRMPDYAKDCENAVQTEYERLEMVAKKEEERLELLLSDDYAIYDLIEQYDLYSALAGLVRAYDEQKPWGNLAGNFVTQLLKSAKHSVEQ